MILHRANIRRGISLLEVIIALAVFLIGYIAIYQLMNVAANQAIELTNRNQASQLAQRKLAEVVCGSEQGDGGTFDDPDGDYSWTADIQAGAVDSLQLVSVSVTYRDTNVKVTLSQMMLKPANIGSTQDTPPAPLSSTSSASTTTPSTTTPSTTTPSTTTPSTKP